MRTTGLGAGQGIEGPARVGAGSSCTRKRLLTASPVRWGRWLVTGAAVVAAGATSRITEGGADRHCERQACKHAREYLASGDLHANPTFPPQISACRLTRRARRADAADAIRTPLPHEVKRRISLRQPGTDEASFGHAMRRGAREDLTA